MTPELTLKTHHKPSLFNKDMLLGGLLGAFVPGGLIVAGIGIVGGALVGGYLGKRTQEKENHFGKKVGEPTAWNKEALIGGLIGTHVGGIAGALAFMAIAGIGILALASGGAAAIGLGTLLAGAGVGLATWIGGTVIGAYIGGKSGKKRMAREYEEARQQRVVEHVSRNVSPEIGQAVGYSMEHNKEWAKGVLEEKLLSTPQQGLN